MFPNIRAMTVAMFASVFALSFGFGLFAEFRVNHEPLARPPVIAGPVQPDDQRVDATRFTAADIPFATRFQTPEPQQAEISSPSPGPDFADHDEPQLPPVTTIGTPEPESEPPPAVVGTLTAESPLQYAGLPNTAQCVDLPIEKPAPAASGAAETTASAADVDREPIAPPAESPPPGQADEHGRGEPPQPDLAPIRRTQPEEKSAAAAVEPLISAPAVREIATVPEIKIAARQKPAAKPRRAAIARQRLAARTHHRLRPRWNLAARNVEQQPFNVGYPQLFQIGDEPLLNVQTEPQPAKRHVVLRRHRPAIQVQLQKNRTQQSAVGGPFVEPQGPDR